MSKIILFFLLIYHVSFAQKIHSHNDYEQNKPFWDAFNAGANSIEVDVFLYEGQLYVAHQSDELRPRKTLQSLYLEPLNEIVNLEKRQSLQILIDVKTSSEPTLQVIMDKIEKFPNLVNAFSKDNYIKFVISGNRPLTENYSSYPNYIFFDHQLLIGFKEAKKAEKTKIAMFSFSFAKYSKWDGKNKMTREQKQELKPIISHIHSLGFPIRFWATPDLPLAWKELHKLGVDFINTDQPQKCINYFSK